MSTRVSEYPATLGGQFRRHVRAYMQGGLMLAAFQVAMNRIDWLSKSAVDGIFSNTQYVAWHSAAAMLALSVVAFVTRVASRWFIFNAGRDVEYEMRAILLARLHKLGTAFYRTMSTGQIMSRSSGDLLQVRLLFGFGVLNMVNVVFAFASALQVMVSISGRLTLASFVMLPVLIVTTRSFSKGLFSRTRENQVALGKLSDVLQTNLAGVRVVRSFALEDRERARFDEANQEYLVASLSLARLRGLMGPMVGASAAMGVLACFWYGGTQLESGRISRGDFFAFWLALGRMTWPMVALGFSISIVQRGRAGFTRLQEIFDAVPEISDGTKSVAGGLAAVRGGLRVEHLGFKYGERAVLSDVSFELAPGKSLAIMGRTGSGKSTLALLIARLLPTPNGTVFLDGTDVCDLPLSLVRGAVGYAQQDAFLFSTTVAANVGLAMDDSDSEESKSGIREATRRAHVLEEALSLPEGFDTVVGERGVQLSGGQKQRVSLARALVRKSPVLLLDDPLSAVDAKTEARILDTLDEERAARSLVLVTHRIAAAKRCDRIVVLEQGRVVQVGTHAELAQQDGIYKAFIREQERERQFEELDKIAAASGGVRG